MSAVAPIFMTLEKARRFALAGIPIRRAAWNYGNEGITFASKTFTVNATTDVVTCAGHGFHDGLPLLMDSSSALPAATLGGADFYLNAQTLYARDCTEDTFKLAATPGGDAIDLTNTGTGTHSVWQATKRAWLKYEHTEWWLHFPDPLTDEPRICNAVDLDATDYDAADWTTLSESCLAGYTAANAQKSPTPISDDTCALPALPSESDEPSLIPVEAVVTEPTTSGTTTGGDQQGQGADEAGSLGGGGGSGTGTATGDGSGSLGGGGGSGGGDSGGGGGTSGGGGGGDGGGGGGGNGGGQPMRPAWTPWINVSAVTAVADGSIQPDSLSWTGGNAAFIIQLSIEELKAGEDPWKMYLTQVFLGGAKVWSGWMQPGQTFFDVVVPHYIGSAPGSKVTARAILYNGPTRSTSERSFVAGSG